MNTQQIAHIAQGANRALKEIFGDTSVAAWDNLTDLDRFGLASNVDYLVQHPDATAASDHEAWMESKYKEGWKFGKTMNIKKKLHPGLVPYDQLDEAIRASKELIYNISRDLIPFITPETIQS